VERGLMKGAAVEAEGGGVRLAGEAYEEGAAEEGREEGAVRGGGGGIGSVAAVVEGEDAKR